MTLDGWVASSAEEHATLAVATGRCGSCDTCGGDPALWQPPHMLCGQGRCVVKKTHVVRARAVRWRCRQPNQTRNLSLNPTAEPNRLTKPCNDPGTKPRTKPWTHLPPNVMVGTSWSSLPAVASEVRPMPTAPAAAAVPSACTYATQARKEGGVGVARVVRLWCCPAVVLPGCAIAPLCCRPAVELPGCGIVRLWRCPAVLSPGCGVARLWCCPAVLSPRCAVARLWRCPAVVLHADIACMALQGGWHRHPWCGVWGVDRVAAASTAVPRSKADALFSSNPLAAKVNTSIAGWLAGWLAVCLAVCLTGCLASPPFPTEAHSVKPIALSLPPPPSSRTNP
eukprot:363582-Chlamydomonas_euryale.AAC.2